MPRCRTGSRPIGIRRDVFKGKHTSDAFHIAGIAGYENSSDLATRVRQEDVKGEAATYLSQLESFLFP
jgi:hypothetical protein